MNNRLIIFTILVLLGCACHNSRQNKISVDSKSQQMAEENLTLKVSEVHQVRLQSRGATGLQLMYRCDDESIVEIKQVDAPAADTSQNNIGGPVPALFEIKGLKAGKTKIQFYETRPWDKNFKEIMGKEFVVEVR